MDVIRKAHRFATERDPERHVRLAGRRGDASCAFGLVAGSFFPA